MYVHPQRPRKGRQVTSVVLRQLTLPTGWCGTSTRREAQVSLTVIDLFCGAGGFSQGLKEAGHEIILAIDSDETAVESHELNHPHSEHWLEDVRDLNRLPHADAVVGSPPCREFSRGNPLRTLDLSLSMEFLRLALSARPKCFLMENVPSAGKLLPLKGRVIDSADFGVPQHRHRWFGGLCPPPLRMRTSRCITVKEAVGRVVNKRVRNGFPQKIVSSKPSPTLVAHWSKRGSEVPFSTRELLILAGFPSTYRLAGPRTAQVRQIGNAVSPPVARAFGVGMSSGNSIEGLATKS
jgi:DNA (cytosine-5)-methyltransferase 1